MVALNDVIYRMLEGFCNFYESDLYSRDAVLEVWMKFELKHKSFFHKNKDLTRILALGKWEGKGKTSLQVRPKIYLISHQNSFNKHYAPKNTSKKVLNFISKV